MLIVAAHPILNGGEVIGTGLVSKNSQQILSQQRETLRDIVVATLILFALVFFSLLFHPLSVLLELGVNAMSRKHEFEADAFAATVETSDNGVITLAAAAVGLKGVTTGDTICDPKHPIVLEAMTFPEPVIAVAIEPKTKADQDKLAVALQRLAEEDPTFRVHNDEESGQTLIAGMGELHLDVLVDRMVREFKVAANVGKPQVSYRESIRRAAEGNGRFVRQTGGRGQYGHAVITLEPGEKGSGYEFVDKIVGGVIPREYIKSVDAGIREALETGVYAGFPMVDVKATLFDGSTHDVDSSEMAFKIAGSMAIKNGLKKASPQLLEPMMDVEVVTPEEPGGALFDQDAQLLVAGEAYPREGLDYILEAIDTVYAVREGEAAIRDGRLPPGERLPTIRALSGTLGVSAATVASAFRTLQQRGLVVSDGRRGSRVTHRMLHPVRPSLDTRGVRNLHDGNPDPALLPDQREIDEIRDRMDVTWVAQQRRPWWKRIWD